MGVAAAFAIMADAGETAAGDVHAIVQRADKLFEDRKWHEALEYLEQYGETEELDLLWRLMRINYRVGKHITPDRKAAERMAARGMELSERALKISDKHFLCQKWTAIVLSWYSELQGQKKRIEKSFEVRDHLLKAAELKPSDASVKHLLGRWCFKVTSIPWYLRSAASMIFATPPTSTYEEALSYFDAAEKADPGFYVPNWLYLGKCHMQLGDKEEAREWLKKAADHQGDVPDDKEAHDEAKTMLGKL